MATGLVTTPTWVVLLSPYNERSSSFLYGLSMAGRRESENNCVVIPMFWQRRDGDSVPVPPRHLRQPLPPGRVLPRWRTDTAVLLAKQMYESREFSAMPILADALQDAGCDNDDMLNHCRDANQARSRLLGRRSGAGEVGWVERVFERRPTSDTVGLRSKTCSTHPTPSARPRR